MLKYEDITQDMIFQDWFKYEPHDVQYVRFCEDNPSAIAAGYKIADVYRSFAMARASLLFSLENNYGDLAKPGDDLLVRTLFVQNAILQYSICEDLSWQVAWAYILPADITYLMNNEYEKMSKECNRDNLIEQLDCGISQHSLEAEKIKEIIVKFDDDEDIKKFRTLYNFLKHRGNIHVEGLGNEDEYLMSMVNGKAVKILSREKYTLEQLQDLTWNYHQKFEKYFSELITAVIPDDYTNNSVTLGEWIISNLKMADAQKNKN
ncbi:hypothetical protein [Butyrivibrio sp. LC3010]|uniref:hypothetical protein n=1 Tax=Butyrivibrio sp. LC3010 TaxID=1280680 RepID=UPI00041DEDC3|nr:hypothetical protein [Butyrivibrio sp. LC3010]